jgi:hypothetical protein
MEEEHKCNEKMMKVIDEGDRISHPVEYSNYHEEEPENRRIKWLPKQPKVEYSSYMEEEGEKSLVSHPSKKNDELKT